MEDIHQVNDDSGILSIIQQEVNSELFRSTQGKRIDVNQILRLHQKIKAKIQLGEISDQTIPEVWNTSGDFMVRMNNNEIAEICYFMAVLYDKTNSQYLDQLIDVYVKNKKYRFAIDFLEKLYLIEDEKSDILFWSRLVDILPKEELVNILTRPKKNSLEDVIDRFDLNTEEVMTWMMIGYTLKTLDIIPNHLVLANQALDNALALKYFI